MDSIEFLCDILKKSVVGLLWKEVLLLPQIHTLLCILRCQVLVAPETLGQLSFAPPCYHCCISSAEMSLPSGTLLEEGGGQDHPTGCVLFWAMTILLAFHGGSPNVQITSVLWHAKFFRPQRPVQWCCQSGAKILYLSDVSWYDWC